MLSKLRIRGIDGIHLSIWFHSVFICVNGLKRIQLGVVFFPLCRRVFQWQLRFLSTVPSALAPPPAQSPALNTESVALFMAAERYRSPVSNTVVREVWSHAEAPPSTVHQPHGLSLKSVFLGLNL